MAPTLWLCSSIREKPQLLLSQQGTSTPTWCPEPAGVIPAAALCTHTAPAWGAFPLSRASPPHPWGSSPNVPGPSSPAEAVHIVPSAWNSLPPDLTPSSQGSALAFPFPRGHTALSRYPPPPSTCPCLQGLRSFIRSLALCLSPLWSGPRSSCSPCGPAPTVPIWGVNTDK